MKKLVNILGHSASVFVVMIILLFIIPVPPVLLDFLFIVQLGLSLIILLMSMYVKQPLDLSAFPTVLLLMTVFRLGLNISSTKSILSNNGYAGRVIDVFGSLVIRNNVIVGLVIFLIIVLVQFIVITKGAERIAEVSARFTLDAMPGKQMAIDSGIQSGLIDEHRAAVMRENIGREASFFGAMDGASKFVKGDAVMSIIVTLVNLIGGAAIGITNGAGSLSDIISTYSKATVGDGLVSQIPALLTSISTGLIVTRSTAQADMNTDIAKQFSSQPKTFIISGAAVCALLFIGFPPVQVLLVCSVLVALGIYKLRENEHTEMNTEKNYETDTSEISSVPSQTGSKDDLYELLEIDQMNIDFGYGLLSFIDENNSKIILDHIASLRKHFAKDLGILIPSVKLNDSKTAGYNQYRICIKGEEIVTGEVFAGYLLVMSDDESDIRTEGIETVDPVFSKKAKWITEDKRHQAELMGYTVIDPVSVIITHLSHVISRHAYEILSRTEVYRMLDNLRKNNESLVNDVIPSLVTVGELHKVMACLLKENIPVRDLETIISTLGDCAHQTRDIDVMTERVRISLRRAISHRFAHNGVMEVIGLDHKAENKILSSISDNNGSTYIDLDQSDMHSLIVSAGNEIKKAAQMTGSVVILTSGQVRLVLKHLIERYYPDAVVLSLGEIDPQVHVKSLGNITIG